MDRSQKERVVAELHETFSQTNLLVVTRQSGLTVAEATELRRQMRAAGARYQVTKNRLAKLALKGTPYEGLTTLFTGPVAIACSSDPVAAAKVAVDFAKGNEKLTVVGGGLGERELDVDGVMALAKLPSLDELRSQMIALIQAPATKVAGVLQAPAGQLARVFSAYGNKEDAA